METKGETRRHLCVWIHICLHFKTERRRRRRRRRSDFL